MAASPVMEIVIVEPDYLWRDGFWCPASQAQFFKDKEISARIVHGLRLCRLIILGSGFTIPPFL
jgi:hypothetical protein